MRDKIKFRLKIVLVVSYMIFIYVFSEYKFPVKTPSGSKKEFDPFPFYHVCEFGLLSLLLMYAFYGKINIGFIISISISYSIFDEIHQYFVPYRYFDLNDVFHDVVGSVLGIIGFFVLVLVYCYLYVLKIKWRRL